MRNHFNGLPVGLLPGGAIGWFASNSWYSRETSPANECFKQEVAQVSDATIGKAVLLAMETDGVVDVTANWKVKGQE